MFCVIIPSSLMVLLATRFSYYIGYKTVIRICALLFTFMPLVLNIKFNFITLAVCFLFFPMMCFSLSAIPIINCLWSQFPKDLNKLEYGKSITDGCINFEQTVETLTDLANAVRSGRF